MSNDETRSYNQIIDENEALHRENAHLRLRLINTLQVIKTAGQLDDSPLLKSEYQPTPSHEDER